MVTAVYNTDVLSVHLQSFSVAAVGAQSVVRFDIPTLHTLRQSAKVAHFAIHTLLYNPRKSMYRVSQNYVNT